MKLSQFKFKLPEEQIGIERRESVVGRFGRAGS